VRKHFILLSVLCLILPLLFLGCEGDDGAAGIAGTPGTPGDPGPGALANETCVVCHGEGRIADVAVEHDTFTGTADIQIDDASFNTADNTAAVTFTVVSATDANGVDITDAVASVLTDLDPNNSTRLAHMRFTIARLIPGVIYGATGRDPDSWDFYGPRSHRTASQLVDNGGNNFTFTFVDDVALDPGEVGYTHRVGIEIYNLPSGLRSVNPTFDFVPDGVTPLLTREIVVTANCNECHDPLGYTPRFHGSRRVEIKHCVLCHNPNDGLAPESADPGAPNVPIPFVKLVHAIHTAQFLNIFEGDENEGDFREVHFPQDPLNCTKCHRGGADSDNWKNRPTLEACGSCHIDVDFAAGIPGGHPGGSQTTNQNCIFCHNEVDESPIGGAISVAHRTENVTPNNQELPTGLSRFEYFLDNVAVDNNGVATVGFRITQDGAPFDLQTWEDGVGTTFTDRTPTFLLAWAKSQDGIDEPAEYNNKDSLDPPSSTTGNGGGDAAAINIEDLWNAGNITGDSAGYTATLLDNTWIDPTRSFPQDATMRAVALQSYFEQIVGGEEIGRHTPSVMKAVSGCRSSPGGHERVYERQ
jgi:OmcA/MtrC family decaheme c-type cytochrome